MRFEIYRKGKLIKRGIKTLAPLEFDNELMYAPTCQMVLPIEYLEYLDGREEVKIFVNDKCFWAIVWNIEADKVNETVTIELRHAITEWQYRQISVNHAISDQNLNVVYEENTEPAIVDSLEEIYKDKNFSYPGWHIEFLDGSGTEKIDYVYSKQDKLEALTQTMELTDDLFWRVHFWNEKKVQIGRFGEQKPYIFSTKRSGETNIRIIEEPIIEYDFENVVNVASVYSDKSDSGMSSLTLREVYERPNLQKQGFPVVILHANVNNERDYSKYITQYPKLAPNNELEYAVLDEVSIALESGTLIEGAYAFNDIDPFEVEEKDKVIPDEKRIEASQTVYDATIKKLIQARRGYNVTLLTEELPSDLIVGDRVRLLYDNSLWNLDACSNYWKKILSLNDWWYLTRIEYAIDNYGVETNRVTLTKWLRIERETSNSR